MRCLSQALAGSLLVSKMSTCCLFLSVCSTISCNGSLIFCLYDKCCSWLAVCWFFLVFLSPTNTHAHTHTNICIHTPFASTAYLCNPLASSHFILHLGEVMVIWCHVCHDDLLIRSVHVHIWEINNEINKLIISVGSFRCSTNFVFFLVFLLNRLDSWLVAWFVCFFVLVWSCEVWLKILDSSEYLKEGDEHSIMSAN